MAEEPGILVFLIFTIGVMGGAAWLTGQGLAAIWRPWWQVVAYCLLLTAFDRFLVWGLFGGDGRSLWGALRDGATLVAIGGIAYRVTLVGKMVGQYPWLYTRRGPFGYRRLPGAEPGPGR